MLQGAALSAVAAIVVLSWLPRNAMQRTGAPGPLEHVVAYCGAAGLAVAVLSGERRRWLGLAFVILAAVLETGQVWVPGRVAQFKDFAAGGAGAILGLTGCWALRVGADWIAERRAGRLSPGARSRWPSTRTR